MSPGLNVGSPGNATDEAAETEAARASQSMSSPSLSRSASRAMRPPLMPHSTASSSGSVQGDNTGVGGGPGPLRHPRPMTISDIHLELEKEQEAVVNRLTRELSLLRAQTASVASTASSTSTNVNDQADGAPYSAVASPRATSTSRHRSSSTLSSRSIGGSSYVPGSAVAALTSVVPSRDTGASSSRQSMDFQRPTASREASGSFPRLPEMASPPLHSPHSLEESAMRAHRRSESVSSTTRYEEGARHRAELEVVKRENESLRRRVRELEKILRERRN